MSNLWRGPVGILVKVKIRVHYFRFFFFKFNLFLLTLSCQQKISNYKLFCTLMWSPAQEPRALTNALSMLALLEVYIIHYFRQHKYIILRAEYSDVFLWKIFKLDSMSLVFDPIPVININRYTLKRSSGYVNNVSWKSRIKSIFQNFTLS